MNISITLSPGSMRTMERLRRFPDILSRAIRAGQDEATKEVTAIIRAERLRGRGPFPVEEHRLGQVTDLLQSTTRAQPTVQISANTFQSKIVNDAPYTYVHETGFHGIVEVRAHNRGIAPRTTRRGSRIGGSRAQASVSGHRRVMDIPARAPFLTGLIENAWRFGERINEAIPLEFNRW